MLYQMAQKWTESTKIRGKNVSNFFNLWTTNSEIFTRNNNSIYEEWEQRLAVEICQCKKQKLRKKEAKNCPTN